MGLKGMLSGNWFTRLVMVSWIICAVAIFVVFKNMELIVHGQLYYYGLIFSAEWADAYRVYTWLIFLFLGLPMALSGIALVSSFFKVEQVPEKRHIVTQRPRPQLGVAKAEPRKIVREAPKRVERPTVSVNSDGISCPSCKKVFGRALVMLDFRSGRKQLVSVCPYCNYILGNTTDTKGTNVNIYVATQDEKEMH